MYYFPDISSLNTGKKMKDLNWRFRPSQALLRKSLLYTKRFQQAFIVKLYQQKITEKSWYWYLHGLRKTTLILPGILFEVICVAENRTSYKLCVGFLTMCLKFSLPPPILLCTCENYLSIYTHIQATMHFTKFCVTFSILHYD